MCLIDCCCPTEEEVYCYHYYRALWHIKKEGIREMKKYRLKGKKENVDRSLKI
jgi:hypothetical protein